MNKLDYIVRSLGRTTHKKYEHYVVSRIWHLLNDLDIKFVTQQYVKRENGERALTDMYFPQFGLHIEVDEGFHKNQISEDKAREADIISVTGHEFLRVDVTSTIEEINAQIDEIVKYMREKKPHLSDFKPWNFDLEQNPKTYIERGYMRVNDDVAFEKSVDAVNCFGYAYKGFQRAGVKHPIENDTTIWFPKLYENEGWKNSISNDDEVIISKSKDAQKAIEVIDNTLKSSRNKRIIFARVISPLGDVMYRFMGLYKLDVNSSTYETGLVWRRIAQEVETYKPKK